MMLKYGLKERGKKVMLKSLCFLVILDRCNSGCVVGNSGCRCSESRYEF